MDSKDTSKSEPTSTTTATAAPPAVFIVVQSPALTPDDVHFEKTFSKKLVTFLAATQLVSAGLAIISQIVLIAKGDNFGPIGAGIWCGVFYAISGGLGVAFARKPSTCGIISFMVMSILSACSCIPLVVFSSVGLSTSVNMRISWHYAAGYGELSDASAYLERLDVQIACYAVEVIVSLAVAVAAITSSAVSCRAVCCRKPKAASALPVLYSVNGMQGQPIPLEGFPAGFPFGRSQDGDGLKCNSPPPDYSSALESEATGGDYKRFA